MIWFELAVDPAEHRGHLLRVAEASHNVVMLPPTVDSALEGREAVLCPICKRQLFVTPLPEGKARFDGCGKNCAPMYWVPEDSVILGIHGGVMFVHRKKWNPNEPEPKTIAKYTNAGW